MSTERSNAMAEAIFGERLNEGILKAIEDALSRLADRDLSPEELQAAVSAALDPAFEEASVVLAEGVWKHSTEGLISNKGIEAGFERGLELRWADALDAYRVVMSCAREMGEEYSRRFAKEADQAELATGSFDLVVNDMVMDPAESVSAMVGLAPVLKQGGLAVMTVKLPFRQPWPSIRRARTALEPACEVVAIRHLPHNRQEVTALLRKL